MADSIDILDMVSDLKQIGEPFAVATVVRTVSVTSAKAGAKALIQKDGTVSEGWVGGGCAKSAVLKAAKDALTDGAPRLISIQPEDLLADIGVSAGDEKDGVKFASNMCPSQGTMDIFVEPVMPRPELVIFGASPVAVALSKLSPFVGFTVTVYAPKQHQLSFPEVDRFNSNYDSGSFHKRNCFMVIATQGSGDEAALASAFQSDADYLAFVGSHKKAENLKEKLSKAGIPDSRLSSLKAPAGLDIKAITPEEIALSILAEVVQHRRLMHAKLANQL